mmetsp:Transcript_16451/g.24879  ORF Transcript_16451/g.24879 Transcript_16451/m.24879 type:complete len:227 (+) Transcript_16451:633-1313(+)
MDHQRQYHAVPHGPNCLCVQLLQNVRYCLQTDDVETLSVCFWLESATLIENEDEEEACEDEEEACGRDGRECYIITLLASVLVHAPRHLRLRGSAFKCVPISIVANVIKPWSGLSSQRLVITSCMCRWRLVESTTTPTTTSSTTTPSTVASTTVASTSSATSMTMRAIGRWRRLIAGRDVVIVDAGRTYNCYFSCIKSSNLIRRCGRVNNFDPQSLFITESRKLKL